MVRFSTGKFAVVCFMVVVMYGMHISFSCRAATDQHAKNAETEVDTRKEEPSLEGWQKEKLAVIVPFRDRFEELMEFIPWMNKFLNEQKIPHKFVVVNQVDLHRFNRAALINIGYLKTREECDYVVMHDVDLLPNNPELSYSYPEKGPYHLASPEYHPLYHYKTYIGGVLMMKNEHFAACNGMSNKFWGWGREDDELYLRFKDNHLTLFRPTKLTSGYQTFKHIHNKQRRARDYNRYGDQKKAQFKRDTETGFDTVEYVVQSERNLSIDNAPLTIYNVELVCDLQLTPWCDHPKKQ